MMELPKYKPEQWVVFDRRGNVCMGQIVSARYYKPANEQTEQWQYTIMGKPDTTNTVAEDQILAIFDGINWHRNGPAKSLREAGVGG